MVLEIKVYMTIRLCHVYERYCESAESFFMIFHEYIYRRILRNMSCEENEYPKALVWTLVLGYA